MAQVIVPASPSDLASISTVMFQAFQNDVGLTAIYPKGATPASLACMTSQWDKMMEEDDTAHFMLVKDAMSHEIMAYAIWHFLPPKDPERVEDEVQEAEDHLNLPPEANKELGKRLVTQGVHKRIGVAAKHFGRGKPYAFLSLIGTSPNHQRKGAASKLLDWGLERADDRALPAYLEATPAGIPLYRKHGFYTVDTMELDFSPAPSPGIAHECMIRLPKSV